jgi:hypothetical protein
MSSPQKSSFISWSTHQALPPMAMGVATVKVQRAPITCQIASPAIKLPMIAP